MNKQDDDARLRAEAVVRTHDADARLRAHAPELLAALECCLADLQGILPVFEPDGDRQHSGWQSVQEAREVILAATA